MNQINRSLRCFIILALASSSVSALTPKSAGQERSDKRIKLEYNAERDISQITLDPVILASRKLEELRLGAVTAYKGQVKTRPESIALIFLSLSKTEADKYESARKLTVVADGQHISLGEAQRSKQMANGLFIETMTISIPTDVFVRVFRSKEVSLKLGVTEVELSTSQIMILQAFGSYATE